ncbi:MAG TPA: hypothetical protein VI844_03020 [Coxiellaceae bacterium]|nr:hypothetical protein [Coxiellaceae bacterium]
MQCNKRNQRGGTILEVLVAALIFAGALWALVEFQTNLLRERGTIKGRSEALTLINDKMRQFQNYTVIATTSGQFAYDDIVTCASGCTGSTATYTMTWTVTNQTNPTRKDVSITVAWTDATNTAQNISLSSVIAQIQPNSTGKISEML